MQTIRPLGVTVTTLLVTGGLFVFGTSSALAQPGGFSPEMIMDRLDQNGDGLIDPDEMSESRMPIADMARQAGVDASRGLDADDVARVFEQMQRQREEGGGFGRGGDRGGRGGGDRGGRGGFDGGGRGGDNQSPAKSKEPAPRVRVTLDLQSDYLPGDTDADGQLSMSEWLRWKSRAALAEFLSLDRNADGILTPRELSQANTATPVDLATLFPTVNPAALEPATGSPVTSSSPAATASPAPASETAQQQPASTAPLPAASSPPASAADVERHKATAARFFKILDRDRDGKITDLEWQRSSRLRPKFEGAGADLSQPMAEDDFTNYYVKFSTAGG